MKARLAVVFAIVSLLTVAAMPALATNVAFTYLADDGGANDYPGQKDLTAQSSANSGGSFYTAWKWDDTSWNGNNSGDGCSLFDTDADTNTNYALCGTVKGKNPVTLTGVTLYSCTDNRPDRCTGPTVLFVATGATASTYCTVHDKAAGQFDATDTQIECNITLIGAASSPPVSVIGSGTLINTCSYPSQQPNSDPSDCVVTIPAADTATNTTPGGSATFTATLTDHAAVIPAAAGSVEFNLYSNDVCTTLVFTDTQATDAIGEANTSTTVTTPGTYYWTADFTPNNPADFNPSASTCGSEVITVTAPTVQ